jgi:hypothetical protein
MIAVTHRRSVVMKFDLTYDSSVNSRPAGFKTTVEAVARHRQVND